MNRDVMILREKVNKLIPLLIGKGIKVTQRGSGAFVQATPDGRPIRVNIPYIPENATPALIAAIEGFLDHEVGHILFTDFRVTAAAFKVGQKQAVLQNIIEDPWVEKKMQEKFPGSLANIRAVQTFLLDQYITPHLGKTSDPGMAMKILAVPMFRAWAGQQVFIDYMADKWHLVQPFVDQIGDLALDVKKVKSTQDCFDLAQKILAAIKRDMEMPTIPGKPCDDGDEGEGGKSGEPEKSEKKPGKEKKPSEPSEDDEEDTDAEPAPSVDPFEDDKPGEDDSDDDADKGDPFEDDTGADMDADGDEGEDGADDGEGDLDAEGDAEGEDRADGDSGEGESDDGSDGSDEGGDATDTDGGAEDAGKAEEARRRAEAIDEILEGTEDFDSSVSEALSDKMAESYKEADYVIYTKDFDVIEPLEVKNKTIALAAVTRTDEEIRPIIGVMQKGLERYMAAQSRAVNIPGYRKGRLHGAALSRMMLGDDRVFRRREEYKSKETAVTLLVDCSGSMSEGVRGAHKRRIDVAADAAYALGTVLERINVKFEALGFTTTSFGTAAMPKGAEREIAEEQAKLGVRFSRYEAIHMPIFKGFNERMTSETKARFAAMKSELGLYNNVDGESLEYAAHRLAQRREVRKIIIVLSDGDPACYGDSAAQHSNLIKTVQQVEKSGIEVLGIGIATSSVKEYYKKNLVISNVGELPAILMSKMAELLRS